MSYTRLVAYSVGPALLIVCGVAIGDEALVIALVGAVVEAFVLARFFDRKKTPPGEQPMPPNVFK